MEICSYVCITKHITIHERIPRFPSQTYVRTYLTYGLELIFYFDQVRGVRPLPLLEMANLFNSLRLVVCPGLDPNTNNLIASTTFYSESTRAMLCLVRIETDPADRTQLRMTVASGDPTLTFELKEFIKEQLVSLPTAPGAPEPPMPLQPQPQPTSPPPAVSDPGALLAGLL